jgi:hypothetical protein
VSVQKRFFLLTLRFSQNFILGDKRAQRDFDINYMHPKGTSCGAPAVKFIERLGLKEKLSSQEGHKLGWIGDNKRHSDQSQNIFFTASG